MEIKIKRRDVVWGYLGTITSMLANLVIIPFVLYKLNNDEIGLYYIFAAVSSISQLFDFGFSPSIARSVAYIWTGVKELKKSGVSSEVGEEPNYALLRHIIQVCRRFYFVMGIVALILLLVAGSPYIVYVSRNIEGYKHYIAWGIYVVAIVLNILFGYYMVMLRGVGNIIGANKSMVFSRVIQFILSIIFLLTGCGLIGIALAYLLYGLVYRVLAGKFFYSYENISDRLKECKVASERYKVLDTIKTLWPNTWREGLITLSEYLLNQATTVISSLFLSLYETGIFSFSMQMVTAIATISMTLFSTYQPTLQSAFVTKNKEMLRKYMSLGWFSYVIMYAIGMFLLMTIGMPVVLVIKPTFEVEYLVLILAGVYQFILKYRNCCTSYISSTNRLIYTNGFIVSAIVCLVFSYIFTKYFNLGMYGLLYAQILSQLIYNAWRWPILVHRELNLSFLQVVDYGFNGMIEIVFGKLKRNL